MADNKPPITVVSVSDMHGLYLRHCIDVPQGTPPQPKECGLPGPRAQRRGGSSLGSGALGSTCLDTCETSLPASRHRRRCVGDSGGYRAAAQEARRCAVGGLARLASAPAQGGRLRVGVTVWDTLARHGLGHASPAWRASQLFSLFPTVCTALQKWYAITVHL